MLPLPSRSRICCPAVSAGQLGQHGQGHIDVQGGVHLVLSLRPGQELPDARGKEGVQPVGVPLGLIQLRPAVCPPGVVDLGKALIVEFAGDLVRIVHLIGIGGHLGVLGLGDGVSRGSQRRTVRPKDHAARDRHGQHGGHGGGPPAPAPGLLLLRALHQVVPDISDRVVHLFAFFVFHTHTPSDSRKVFSARRSRSIRWAIWLAVQPCRCARSFTASPCQ